MRICTECEGAGKLRSYWKNDIYKMVDCEGGEKLVYEVQP